MSDEKHLEELLDEKELLDPHKSVHTMKLLESEISRVQAKVQSSAVVFPSERKPFDSEEHVNISKKVIIPIEKHPTYNFVGKLLGPRGSTLKNIAAATKTKISILGKGSTRDQTKERELLESEDPEHEHLKEPLHVLIQVAGPRHIVNARLTAALEEINRYMDPANAELMQKQMHAAGSLNPSLHNITGFGNGMVSPIRFGIPPPGAIVIGGQFTGQYSQSNNSGKSPNIDTRTRKRPNTYNENLGTRDTSPIEYTTNDKYRHWDK